jgi:HD-GYP domain-containing protein (c-di-GMP phosphodiesterase class II)
MSARLHLQRVGVSTHGGAKPPLFLTRARHVIDIDTGQLKRPATRDGILPRPAATASRRNAAPSPERGMAMRFRPRSVVSPRAVRTTSSNDYGGSHESRVAIVAVTIAQEMAASADARQAVVASALLHDVGKSLLPRHLCEKPTALTPNEWKLMRRHPEMSEQIARRFISSTSVLGAIRAHHERWDGGGYPDALRTTSIPQAGRILAVADAFVAMTEDRPYRDALPPARARLELRRERARQFDPDCVDAFERSAGVIAHRLLSWQSRVCSLEQLVDSAVERLQAEVHAAVNGVLAFVSR